VQRCAVLTPHPPTLTQIVYYPAHVRSPSNTYIDAQRSGMPLISRTEEVAVYSDRSYKKFEQVTRVVVMKIEQGVRREEMQFLTVDLDLSLTSFQSRSSLYYCLYRSR
jgi:hypothetical protein